jgi:CheY-like chemotaxis protein
VLVVEDDPDIRESLQLLLEESGYAVTIASHGREAWDQLEAGLLPDVILLDLNMPVMNGWELFELLRTSRFAATPLIVVTAGMDAPPAAPVLRKPIAMKTLLHSLERAAA